MTNDPYEVEPAGSIEVTKLAAYVKGFRMPAGRRREGCTEAGVRKASKEESARVFAPAAVSVYGEVYGDLTQVYGDLTRGSELHVRAPTRTPGE